MHSFTNTKLSLIGMSSGPKLLVRVTVALHRKCIFTYVRTYLDLDSKYIVHTLPTLSTSRGYFVTLCIGLSRKLLRGSPPVRGSVLHFCSNSLNFGSEAFCCSSRQALSWQPHQRMCGVRLGIWDTRTSPMDLTISPDVRRRTRNEERRLLEH